MAQFVSLYFVYYYYYLFIHENFITTALKLLLSYSHGGNFSPSRKTRVSFRSIANCYNNGFPIDKNNKRSINTTHILESLVHVSATLIVIIGLIAVSY